MTSNTEKQSMPFPAGICLAKFSRANQISYNVYVCMCMYVTYVTSYVLTY